MLLTFVVILLVIWASVVWSIYSGFLTFYRNFEQTENYNKAYYASIAALERAELAIKQRWPWYEWNWWRQDWVNTWSSKEGSQNTWDQIGQITWFSYLWNTDRTTNVFRNIKARTTRIPSEWAWDTERTISTSDDAKNYNKMDYENAEIFLIYYDSWDNSPYTGWTLHQVNVGSITWVIRLPSSLTGVFWLLNTWAALTTNHNQIKNDPIVDRQIRWLTWNNQFTIYSFSNINGGIPSSKDSVIRESNINQWVQINFWRNKSPISGQNQATRAIISPVDEQISGNAKSLSAIVNSNENKQIRFSLLNLLEWQKWWTYPYLEYYLDFWNNQVSDKYYTINAEWKVWDYKVNLIVQKPTIQESVYWNFTVIF